MTTAGRGWTTCWPNWHGPSALHGRSVQATGWRARAGNAAAERSAAPAAKYIAGQRTGHDERGLWRFDFTRARTAGYEQDVAAAAKRAQEQAATREAEAAEAARGFLAVLLPLATGFAAGKYGRQSSDTSPLLLEELKRRRSASQQAPVAAPSSPAPALLERSIDVTDVYTRVKYVGTVGGHGQSSVAREHLLVGAGGSDSVMSTASQ
jgi:hypothetical protein